MLVPEQTVIVLAIMDN